MPKDPYAPLGPATVRFDDITPLLRLDYEPTPAIPGFEERMIAACEIQDADARDRARIDLLTEMMYAARNPSDFMLVARYIGAIELERGRTNLFVAYFCLAGYSVPGWSGAIASL